MKKTIVVLLISLLPFGKSLAQSEYESGTISIGIVVADLEKSIDFYENVMAMNRPGRVYEINADFGKRSGLSGGAETKIEVFQIEGKDHATEWKIMSFGKDSQHPKQRYIQDDTGMQYATFMVESIKPFLERIKAHNVPLLGNTPIVMDEDRSFILIQDPDGNFIEIIGSPN